MKIAFVSMFYYPTFGGVEQAIKELAERFAKQGHEVHMYCCDSDKYKRIETKEEIINGVHIHRLRYWLRLSLSTFIWPGLIYRLLKDQKYDIIHSHVSGHAYILFSGLIAKIKSTKHVHTTHCPWTDAYRNWKVKIPLFFNNLIFNKINFKLIDKVIAITPWELSILKKWVKEENKINVIPNGVDSILFKRIKINNFRKQFKKKNIVLFFGRLNITKAPDKFVLIAKEILKERDDIEFVIIGPDEGMRNEIIKLIGDEKSIHLLDPIRDKEKIAEMYQGSNVYVLTSYREGLPLTIFEAMASGLPIIASAVNGVPYEIKDDINGFLINYGDIRGFKEKILKVLDNKKLSQQISKNNLEKAKNFNWDKIAKRVMNVYETK